jgi:hypothetical protein
MPGGKQKDPKPPSNKQTNEKTRNPKQTKNTAQTNKKQSKTRKRQCTVGLSSIRGSAWVDSIVSTQLCMA